MMKKATLSDVAALAEVSKATVSRYLKDENVKEDIALRIAKCHRRNGLCRKSYEESSRRRSKNRKEKTRPKKTEHC